MIHDYVYMRISDQLITRCQMKILRIVVIGVVVLFLPVSSSLHAKEISSISVNKTIQKISLGIHAEFMEDAAKDINIEQIISQPKKIWKKSQEAVFNFSFSPAAYWIHFRIDNQQSITQNLILQAAMPLHDYIDVYYVINKSVVKQYKSGDRYPFATRPINSRDFAFPMKINPNQELDVYLRLDTHDGLYDAVPLNLWDEKAYYRDAKTDSYIFGYYYGAILAILIYNALLFFSTKDRLFLYYTFYLGTFFIWNETFRGFAFQYFWPQWPRFNNEILSFSGALIFISLNLFATKFLNTRTVAPWAHRILWFLSAICAITLPMSLLNIYATSFMLIIPAGISSLIILVILALRESMRGSRQAKIFLLAWTILIFSAIIYYMRVFGLLPSNFITEEGLNIGSALEFILLAYALADRINTLTKEKLAAQELANESQRQLTYKLEDMVRERTEELEALNKHLQYASITDELTGLFNRRHFNAVIEKELNRGKRDNKVIAFVIMDIDNFKQYNDHYGHQRGDEALIQVSNLIKRTLKRSSDLAFRLGGEEIGIIVTADSGELAYDFVEALRAGIEAMAISHIENDPPVITASFGMAVVTDYAEITPHTLYGQADRALYKAKDEGRNRVVMN